MLSKFDILRELGKGICVYPLNENNIKENSINLCAGEFAWATASAEIYVDENETDKNKRFSLTQDSHHTLKLQIDARKSAIVDDGNQKYILLLPFSTTLIMTKEVLSIGNTIGGTYHSKVGIVSKGIGHIGTMLGPNFSGDSLIAMHNTSSELVVFRVGESFVSVVFHYLNTPHDAINPTTSGHTDKYLELGLSVSEEQMLILTEDWKKSFDEVRFKMCQSEDYKRIQAKLKEQRNKIIKKYFCKKNIIIASVTLGILIGLFILATWADKKSGDHLWTDRYINVGCSGLIITIVSYIAKFLKNNAK